MFINLFSNSLFAAIAITLTICYFYVRYVFSYWHRRGVPYLRPSFPFGNFGKNFMQQLSMAEQIDELYRSTTEPFFGIHVLFRPTLIIRDTSLIRTILIKDFEHFVDRGTYSDEKNDPLSVHLFSLEGDKWKNVRAKLTPNFTSSKMRAIFSTLSECRHPLLKFISQSVHTNQIIEAHELTASHTTNVIASVAFGIDIDCLADPNIPFRVIGRKIFEMSLKNALRFICFSVNPMLLKWTGLGVVDRDVEQFLMDLTEQTLEMREKHNIVRKDFFQLLVQLRNNGGGGGGGGGGNDQLNDDDEWQPIIQNSSKKITLSLREMSAHAFNFYAAGFESSSTTMTFCLFEIARHPDIQRKIQEEIDHVLAKHDEQLTYDSLNELKYLDCCFDETLRKYSVGQFLNRVCLKDYKIPGTNVVLEKGTAIIVPSFSLHRDEKFYPHPIQFDPSRFFSENKNGKTMIDMPYYAFGDGPRNCIGLRLARMSIKIGLTSILRNYCVDIDDRHIGKELKLSAGSLFLTPADGVYLKFTSRKH